MSDVNNFHIDNPDGVTDYSFTERRTTYGNDTNGYVQENSLVNQNEWSYHASETNDVSSFINNSGSTGQNAGATVPKQDTPSFTNAVANIGNALGGAITGTVAAAVAVVVIVIVTYLSMLSFNVNLVIADMNQLVFQVDMVGFDKDKINTVDITAILTSEQGEKYTQKITTEKTVLLFDNLEANRKYTLVINGEEQTEQGLETREFYKQSFTTSATPVERGKVFGYAEQNNVYVNVENVILIGNEIYTVTVKDEQGKVVFAKDGTESPKEFTFELSEPKRLYCTLAVFGKVYSFTWIEAWEEQKYDFDNPHWLWEDDYSGASIYFDSLNGGDALYVAATVTEDIVTAPTCEETGLANYTASLEYNGNRYTSEKTNIVLQALGHDYHAEFAWTEMVLSDMTQYSVEGVTITCSHDRTHTKYVDLSDREDIVDIEMTAQTCEEDAYTTFTAIYVDDDGQVYSDYRIFTHEGTATGHAYGEPTFEWIADANSENGWTATATFTCDNDYTHTYVLTEYNGDDEHYLLIDRDYCEPSCDEDGYYYFYVMAVFDNMEYTNDDSSYIVYQENTALGHSYVGIFDWDERGDNQAIVTSLMIICENCEDIYAEIDLTNEQDIVSSVYTDATCEDDAYTTFTATYVYEGKTYTDTYVVTEEETALGHAYGDPVYEWVEGGDKGWTVNVTFTCDNDSDHVVTLTEFNGDEDNHVTVTRQDVDPDCNVDGYSIFYASTVFDNKEYFTYEEDCWIVYDEGSAGHDYVGEFAWEQIGDDEYVVNSLTIRCSRCQDVLVSRIDLTNETDVVQSTYTEATCDNDAFITFVATYVYDGVTYTDTNYYYYEQTALGHDYGQPTFAWEDNGEGGYTVTATFVCANDSTHVETVTAESNDIINEGYYNATCEEAGYQLYYVSVEFDGEYYSEEHKFYNDSDPAVGHLYGEPRFDWQWIDNEYVAIAFVPCERDQMHELSFYSNKDDELTVTSQHQEAGGGESAGTWYTATLVFDGDTYTARDFVAD